MAPLAGCIKKSLGSFDLRTNSLFLKSKAQRDGVERAIFKNKALVLDCQRMLIAAIKIYRIFISCVLGHCCRFEPTCSNYAMDAIKQHGSIKGCFLSLRRVLSCHPWHQGGFDPVPEARVKKK